MTTFEKILLGGAIFLIFLLLLYVMYRLTFAKPLFEGRPLRYPGKRQCALYKEQHDEWMRAVSALPHKEVYIKNGEEMSLHGCLFAAEDASRTCAAI